MALKEILQVTLAFEEEGPPLEKLLWQILEQTAAFWQEEHG